MVGRTIGPYRILEAIGAGGMGVVYRAEDTRLGRQVALKFIAPEKLPDESARRRFEREARAASALSHPNICTVHEIAYDGDAPFLVLELLRGRSLKDRLAMGPLPVAEIVDLALPLADALEVAHAQGIVHRDLKPANIFITDRGVPKLLDFGLAKVLAPDAAEADAATRAATADMTGTHAVLGTLPYMSPEQVRGQPLDARTDLFSFGAVLYEMATGVTPFGGDTSGVILENVLTRAPVSPGFIASDCPPALDALITKALEKDRELRYQSAHEMVIDLKRLRGSTSGRTAAATEPPRAAAHRASRRRRVLVGAGIAGAAVATWLFAGGIVGPGFGVDRPVTLELGAIRQVTSLPGLETRPTISPDGRMVAFVWQEKDNTDIWVKQVAGGAPIRITDDPADDTDPDWSPDGSLIAFRSGRRGGGIWVVPALGGDATRVTTFGARPRWSPDGRQILFTRRPDGMLPDVIWVIDYPGGQPVRILGDLAGYTHSFGEWSPDGRRMVSYSGPGREGPGLFVSPRTGREGGAFLEWNGDRIAVPTTRSLWMPDSRALILQAATLAYTPLDSQGRMAGPVARLTTSADLLGDLSADGRTLAFVSGRSARMDIWKVALDPATGLPSGRPIRVIHSSAEDRFPLPLPDNRHLLFLSNREGEMHLYVSDVDGNNARPVDRSRRWRSLVDVTQDGRLVALSYRGDPQVPSEGYVLPFDPHTLEATGPARVLGGNVHLGGFSPDGRFLLVGPADRVSTAIYAFEDFAAAEPRRVEWPLPADLGTRYATIGNSTFSTDGRWILFGVETAEGEESIFAVRPGATEVHEAVKSAYVAMPGLDPRRLYMRNWRSDGMLTEIGMVEFDPVRARATSPYRRVAFEPGPGAAVNGPLAITPDGRWFFFTWTEEEGDIYVADVIVRR